MNQRPLRPERSALAMLSYAPLAWCLILQPAMKTLGRDVDKRPTGCDISRVLFPCRGGPPRRGRRPFIWTRPCGRALPRRESGLPATQQFWATPSSLLGLAPGGVCRAGGLTDAAVRSYRTFSPFPPKGRCIFCGTFPTPVSRASRQPGRWALPTTAAQWCSDFPPPPRGGSGLPRIQPWHYTPLGQSLHREFRPAGNFVRLFGGR